MKALTGFDFKIINKTLTVTAKKSTAKGVFNGLDFAPLTTRPLFFPQNGTKIVTERRGYTVLALNKMKNWTSIYSLLPFTEKHIRAVCRHAGVDVYSQSNDTLMVNAGYLALHIGSAKGPRKITLDGKYDVTELFSGKSYGKAVRTITLPPVSKGDTFLFKLKRK